MPLFIFIRAFGLETDKEICQKIIHNENDNEMFNILKESMTNVLFDNSKPKDSNNKEI